MKQFKLLWSISFLFMASGFLMSCSSGEGGIDNINNIKKEVPIVEKYFNVSLALNGIEVSEEPLTKAETDDLKTVYKIIVYYNYKGDGDVTYKYAEGTFDNVNDMQLSMLAGHKYRFICSIWKEVTESNILKQLRGFGYNSSDITNNFKIVQSQNSTSALIPNYFQGTNITTEGGINTNTFLRNYTRFYGELSDYTPTQNGIATIRMVEASSYGLHITVLPPSEGELYVSIVEQYHFYYNGSTISPPFFLGESFTNKSEKYDDGGRRFIVGENLWSHYSDVLLGKAINEEIADLPIEIRWKNYNEAGVQTGNSSITKNVKLKRDIMTNVNINLSIKNAETNDASIGFTYYDSNELTTSEENWTVTVDENGTMDVTVIPQ